MTTSARRFRKPKLVEYSMVSLVIGSFLLANLFVLLRDLRHDSSETDPTFQMIQGTINATDDGTFCDSLSYRSVPFDPQSFMQHGPGRSYLDHYEMQVPKYSQRKNKRLLKIRFLIYNISSSCRPIYYHIHKNGGSTMNVKKDMSTVAVPSVDAYYTPREQALGWEQFQNQTMTIFHQVSKDQKQQNQKQQGKQIMPIFTFLRDPVPRFLSSIGQALKLNNLGSCTKHFRVKKDTLELVDCVLFEIQQSQRFLDEHLEPQIFELYYGTMGMNLSVHLMDLKSMDGVLQDLFGLPSHQLSRRQSKGLVLGFNLSVALLTPQLISRICKVYSMDVLFLKETKVTSTICEDYLTDKSNHG